MIKSTELKKHEEEINQIIEELRALDPHRQVKKIEIPFEDDVFVGYFKVPTRSQYKAMMKKYKDNSTDIIEGIAESNIIFPSREVYKKWGDYFFGLQLAVANNLFKTSGFDSTAEVKNV